SSCPDRPCWRGIFSLTRPWRRLDVTVRHDRRGAAMGSIVRLGMGLLVLTLTATTVAASGGRDPSYGTNGITSVFSNSGGAHVIELAPDGTIVGMVGEGFSARLYRAFADGSLDPGFGTGGILDVPNDNYTNMFVAPDGKILLLGVTSGAAWFIRR